MWRGKRSMKIQGSLESLHGQPSLTAPSVHCTWPTPQGPRMPSCDRPCGCSRGPNVEDGKWYGVRSYLHLFYEDCAGTTLSDDPEGPPVLCPHQSWPTLCWKVRRAEEHSSYPVVSGRRGTSGWKGQGLCSKSESCMFRQQESQLK